jgi:hypothetical protein
MVVSYGCLILIEVVEPDRLLGRARRKAISRWRNVVGARVPLVSRPDQVKHLVYMQPLDLCARCLRPVVQYPDTFSNVYTGRCDDCDNLGIANEWRRTRGWGLGSRLT